METVAGKPSPQNEAKFSNSGSRSEPLCSSELLCGGGTSGNTQPTVIKVIRCTRKAVYLCDLIYTCLLVVNDHILFHLTISYIAVLAVESTFAKK